MALGLGSAALVTGAGGGIGRAVSVALATKGVAVTVVEFLEAEGRETVRLIEAEHAKLAERPSVPSALFIKCDVTVPEQLYDAFLQHEHTYGRLDVLLNNAGIEEQGNFMDDASQHGDGQWRKVVNVNLSAVIDGTRLAVQLLKRSGKSGVIVNVASASGLYPASAFPIYSGTKAGVVMFTRSLKYLRRQGIRVNAFCPEFIETNLTKRLPAKYLYDGFISMDTAVKGIFELLEDESRAGDCLWITRRRGFEYWPNEEEKAKYEYPLESRPGYKSKIKLSSPPEIPKEYKKVVIQRLTSDFRAASRIVKCTFKLPVKPGHVLIKYLYAGVNASDALNLHMGPDGKVIHKENPINFSSGRYMAPGEAERLLPLDAGFEAVGLIAGFGEDVNADGLVLGSPVATIAYGGFAEFQQVNKNFVIPVPTAAPETVAMLTSGLTASIALEQAGRMKSGETVLVTAAAGGTGQFAVQLAKLAGNKVVATCGGDDKAELLKSLGVDRVIDYKSEKTQSVLKTEFPRGIDLIYESVGGEMFKTCLNALARHGRIITIGMISQYQGEKGWQPASYPGLCERLLAKSQTLAGFFLNDYTKLWRKHVMLLTRLYLDKKLKVAVDPTPFLGVESVADAVEYLHSGRSLGKVVVQVGASSSSRKSRL